MGLAPGLMHFFIAAVIAALYFLRKGEKPMTEKPGKEPTQPTTARRAFHLEFIQNAKAVDWKGIPVVMALAVADVETGSGTGNVFKNTNNLFSIVATPGWKGAVYKVEATGYTFRVYSTWVDSMKDFVRMISEARHYGPAYLHAVNRDFKAFFAALQKAGYAGPDDKYAAKLEARYHGIGVV